MKYRGCLIFIVLMVLGIVAMAKPAHMDTYGVAVPASGLFTPKISAALDSMLQGHPQIAQKNVLVSIARERFMVDKTLDFYLLLLLTLLLGIIKVIDPRYFRNLWKAFRNPVLSGRQLKDQLENSSFTGLMMNIFFVLVTGSYIYYLVKLFATAPGRVNQSHYMIFVLIAGVAIIYAAKYAVIKFSGWVFKLDSIAEHYLFNVFFMNKIIGLLLLPFTILMAFAAPALTGPAVVISIACIVFLFVNRYARSWQVFGSFFQFSKFHFFMYLCASEILPLAVLMKLLVRTL